MAGKLATMLGMFSESELVKQLQLIEKLQLPTTVGDISSVAILKAMDNDKKKDANSKKFILPKKIGEVDIVSNIDDDMVLKAIQSYCN
jgi:3-dehydroquinate synthetase